MYTKPSGRPWTPQKEAPYVQLFEFVQGYVDIVQQECEVTQCDMTMLLRVGIKEL